jgi:ribosomal protein S18 acetylase RimI-like enzyme
VPELGPEGLEIRIAGPDDAARLAALVAGFRDHLGAPVPSDAELRVHLPHALTDPGLEFAWARWEGAAVGYTQTRLLPSIWAPGLEAHLEDLFVIRAARGQSVGRALLRHALARAEARGARRFGLNTNERNEAAQELYRSEGLSPVSHARYPGGREVLWARRIGGR